MHRKGGNNIIVTVTVHFLRSKRLHLLLFYFGGFGSKIINFFHYFQTFFFFFGMFSNYNIVQIGQTLKGEKLTTINSFQVW